MKFIRLNFWANGGEVFIELSHIAFFFKEDSIVEPKNKIAIGFVSGFIIHVRNPIEQIMSELK